MLTPKVESPVFPKIIGLNGKTVYVTSHNTKGDLRTCKLCEVAKPFSDFPFSLRTGQKHYLRSECKACCSRVAREWNLANPEKYSLAKIRSRLQKYGLTLEKYYEMLESQGGGCAICSIPPPPGTYLSVDHDHSCCPSQCKCCGKCVRGLLCSKCNTAIAMLGDSADGVRSALRYLGG